MMKGRSGEVLWDDTIRLGIELRKKLRAVKREFEEKERDPARRWFFDPFVPDRVAIPDVASARGVACRAVGERARPICWRTDPRYWELAPGAGWHGFSGLEPGFAMTDPDKLTLLTPGFDRKTGAYEAHGMPAPVVAAVPAREPRRAGEERPQLACCSCSPPASKSSKAGTLVSALVAFKRLHDDNALLDDVMPEFVARRPARYARHAVARSLRRNARLLPRSGRQRPAARRSSRPSTCRKW